MNGQDFLRVIRDAYLPFLTEIGFSMEEPSISGRFYRASFISSTNSVWVSYEPGDNELSVYVFSLEKGRLSEVDDSSKTPTLSDLNNKYMHLVSKEEHVENESYFSSVGVRDNKEKSLLKCAKDLHIVLPRHLKSKGKI